MRRATPRYRQKDEASADGYYQAIDIGQRYPFTLRPRDKNGPAVNVLIRLPYVRKFTDRRGLGYSFCLSRFNSEPAKGVA